ncbi:bis(5'-nucleosyl)-tetraphosphatase (symmetrical) YqeK [Desulforamulus aquiferis]|uniref:bis(5'-nucleosyl)-tetraphosphatase (symmetrical) n=1 Tax=Desulforamulus aquiferis TaxID=1397668 RepID=A0AAW7ZFW0_9FIRM|nr:bis(5'-nucleosyl)-tetraphosphatase (symmetrical) YqeK [Desulforamulus aquiferis]MDO7788262.1 bis(5'-nucleosyl)-tetraphosphatase (symmetrical) YqeK [Desulforamulus aquiferis]RYD03441.1 phosphohydrolase [Desulforamulus aquiferis]
MYNEEYIMNSLELIMPEERFRHSVGVAQTAEKLALKYNADPDKARLAGLLHDVARDFDDNEMLARAKKAELQISEFGFAMPILLHGPIGAIMAGEEFGITDQEILNAIALHTVGSEYMSQLDKILFVADKIEPNRKFKNVDIIRQQVEMDLDLALISCFDESIRYALKIGCLLHPTSIKARNELLRVRGSFRK